MTATLAFRLPVRVVRPRAQDADRYTPTKAGRRSSGTRHGPMGSPNSATWLAIGLRSARQAVAGDALRRCRQGVGMDLA